MDQGETDRQRDTAAAANCLFVGQNPAGCWVVRDRLGLKGGIFANFGAAVQFAQAEAKAAGWGVELTARSLEIAP